MTKWIWIAVMITGCGGGDDGDTVDGRPVDAELHLDGRQPDAPPPPDANPIACAPDGTGTVEGTVDGIAIAPVVRANQITVAGVHVIVLDEAPGACGEPADTGEHLVIGTCSTPVAGTYPIVAGDAFDCPSMNAAALVERGGGDDVAGATGGSLTITGTGACTAGEYTIAFGAETLTGSFDAIVCP